MDHFRRYLAKLFETYGGQSRLARDSGVPQPTLRAWVSGRSDTGKPSMPNALQIIAIAKALDVSIDFLLTGEEFWSELQDPHIKELLATLRGRGLDARLPELCRDFLTLDEEGRKLSLAMMKTYIEHKSKGGSDAERPPDTAVGVG